MEELMELVNNIGNIKEQERIIEEIIKLYQYKIYCIKNNSYNKKIDKKFNKAITEYKNRLKEL